MNRRYLDDDEPLPPPTKRDEQSEDEGPPDSSAVGFKDRDAFSTLGEAVIEGHERAYRMAKSVRESAELALTTYLTKLGVGREETARAVKTAGRLPGISRYNTKALACAALLYNDLTNRFRRAPTIESLQKEGVRVDELLQDRGVETSPDEARGGGVDVSAVLSYINSITIAIKRRSEGEKE